jgi:microcin C transport system ATP-binding protein
MYQGELVETAATQQLFAQPEHPYTQKLINAEPSGMPTPTNHDTSPILETTDLKIWFPVKQGFFQRTVDHIKAVNQLDLTLLKGETLGVVGESGSGKTTLGLAILKLISSEGSIRFAGQELKDLDQKSVKPFRRKLQIVFQDPFGSLSPECLFQKSSLKGYRFIILRAGISMIC